MPSKLDGIITSITRNEDGIWRAARERGLEEASIADLEVVPGTMRGTLRG